MRAAYGDAVSEFRGNEEKSIEVGRSEIATHIAYLHFSPKMRNRVS